MTGSRATSSSDYNLVEMYHGHGFNDDSPAVFETAFIKSMKPVVFLLKLSGFYPALQDFKEAHPSATKRQGRVKAWQSVLLHFYSFLFILLNMCTFGFNMYITNYAVSTRGVMHVWSVTTVITGLLPFQNAFNLAIFVYMKQRNSALLFEMARTYRSGFDDIGKAVKISLLMTIVVVLIPLAMRIAQCVLLKDMMLNWVNAFTMLLIPTLRLWQLLPLIYFCLMCYLLQSWFCKLRRAIMNDVQLRQKSLGYYENLFSQLVNVSRLMGKLFGLFVMTSLGFAVVNLGLSLYFITHAQSMLVVEDEEESKLLATLNETEAKARLHTARVKQYFDFVWGLLQVIIALVYMVLICLMGRLVNEEARQVVSAALSTNPTDSVGRFQVIKCHGRLANQLNWGITVWRAFLVERSLLFTLISTIIAYSLILLRLRSSRPP